MIRLYEGEKTRARVDLVLSEEFEAKVGIHQGFVLPSFLQLSLNLPERVRYVSY